MTRPSTLSLEMSLKVSLGSSQALHPYGVAGTWDQSQSRVEMWEWLVTDDLQVEQDLGRNVIQGDTENNKPIEGQGNFLLWKWEGGEEMSFRAVEQKTSCLSWMSREEPGKFLAILGDGTCGAAGKTPDLKRNQISILPLHEQTFSSSKWRIKWKNCKVLDKRKKWFNIVGKGPSHRNSWKGLPPWTETPSPL